MIGCNKNRDELKLWSVCVGVCYWMIYFMDLIVDKVNNVIFQEIKEKDENVEKSFIIRNLIQEKQQKEIKVNLSLVKLVIVKKIRN